MQKQNKNKKVFNLAAYAGFTMLTVAAAMTSVSAHGPDIKKVSGVERIPHSDDHHRHEETGPSYVSYNNAQRSPARAVSL